MYTNPTSYPITGLFAPPHTLRFEFPDTEGAPATGDADTDVDLDTTTDTDTTDLVDTDTTTDDTPAAPAAPTIDWDDPEVSQMLEERSQQAAEAYIDRMLTQGQEGGDVQQDEFVLDPMADPQEFTQGLVGLLGQILDQRLGPVQDIVERQQVSDAESYVHGTIERLPEVAGVSELLPSPTEGAEDTRQAEAANLIEMMASGFLPAAEAQYGPGERSVQAALRAGAAHVQSTLKSVYDAGRAAREAELKNLSGATTEVRGAGSAELRETAGDEMAWAERAGDRFVTS